MKHALSELRAKLNAQSESRNSIGRGAGISPSVLSRFASGETGLTFQTAETLADYLGYRIVLQPKRKRRT